VFAVEHDGADNILSQYGDPFLEYFNVNIGIGQGVPFLTYHFNIFINNLLKRLATQPLETKPYLTYRVVFRQAP
jgi:hypothetical protein